MNYWTEQEDNIIIKEVKNNFGNISLAIKKATKKLSNRTFTATNFRYYSQLRKKDEIFNLQSNGISLGNNTKNTNKSNKVNAVFIPDLGIIKYIDFKNSKELDNLVKEGNVVKFIQVEDYRKV